MPDYIPNPYDGTETLYGDFKLFLGKYPFATRQLELDHVTALANGGTDDLDNLQTLCCRCNRSKGSRIR